jgi:hypothetical protein
VAADAVQWHSGFTRHHPQEESGYRLLRELSDLNNVEDGLRGISKLMEWLKTGQPATSGLSSLHAAGLSNCSSPVAAAAALMHYIILEMMPEFIMVLHTSFLAAVSPLVVHGHGTACHDSCGAAGVWRFWLHLCCVMELTSVGGLGWLLLLLLALVLLLLLLLILLCCCQLSALLPSSPPA